MPSLVTDFLARPIQAMLDHGVSRSTTAAALCRRLESKSFAISTGNANLDLCFVVHDGQLKLHDGELDQPDAGIHGSPLNLAKLAGDDPEAVIRDGHVKIRGDADVANDFRALLQIVRPDWEEELSRVTGDAIAFEAGRAVKSFAEWAARARHSIGRGAAEYLTEESRDLAAPAELEVFCSDVDQLASAVDRCEAKLKLLREQRGQA